jgi:glucose/mannose-6-phosphate isomerase
VSEGASSFLVDRQSVTELDPHGILALTDGFGEQCEKAEVIGRHAILPTLSGTPRTVVLTGLGGSAAGGDFVRALFEDAGRAAFLVNRDYTLPAFIGKGDLVFCASYSGNTEETLSAFAHAEKVGATIVVISSGGDLTARALAGGHSVIEVPGGQPPRTAMGWMMVPVIVACVRLGLLPEIDFAEAWANLAKGRSEWTAEVPFEANLAKKVAAECFGKIPVLYGLGSAAAVVANRVKCQIHENSKAMAHANGFPELNHNEILGWSKDGVSTAKEISQWLGILFTFGDETAKMKARAKVTLGLVGDSAAFHVVEANGQSLLSRMLWLASFGDYVSVYLARLRQVDPEDIGMINTLKEELAKVAI